jgi:hypothetical protein
MRPLLTHYTPQPIKKLLKSSISRAASSLSTSKGSTKKSKHAPEEEEFELTSMPGQIARQNAHGRRNDDEESGQTMRPWYRDSKYPSVKTEVRSVEDAMGNGEEVARPTTAEGGITVTTEVKLTRSSSARPQNFI